MDAGELRVAINYASKAHANFAKEPGNAVRSWDRATPYVVHPIWCATTLLTETILPAHVRHLGCLALLYHDILEDTDLSLPQGISDEVRGLVEGMTFDSFADERARLWERSDTVKLLKLYDKVSNLLDGAWMDTEFWNTYVEHTLRIAQFVLANYGHLNIVRIAHAVCMLKDTRTNADI